MADLHEILLRIAGESRDAQRAIQDVRTDLKKVPKVTEAELRAKVQQAKTEIDRIKASLEDVDGKTYEAEVQAQIAKAIADVEVFKAALDSIPDKKTVNIDTDKGMARALSVLAKVEQGVVGLGRGIKETQDNAASFASVMSKAFFALKSLGPFVGGLSIALVVSLIPALLAVGSSALGAAAGIGAIAVAAAGAIGPVVALGGALFGRFNKILQARQSAEQAKSAAAREGAKGDQAATAAAEARERAEEGVRDALESRTTAERQVAQAIEDARQAIADANRRVVEADQARRDSVRTLAQAYIDAYRAMEDSVERVKDAVLDLQDAELGREEAALSLREAKQELEDFRNEAGLAGNAFDDLFKKFSNVDADVGDLRAALRGAGVGPGDISGSDELKLERLILAVQRARLGEKKATDGVKDSQTELTRAREDDAKFQKEGIRAFEPLRSALQAQARAQQEYADASREANKLNRDGVNGAPSVIAALEGLRDARQALTRAQRAASKPEDLTAAQTAAEVAKQKYEELTEAEQGFFDAIQRTGGFITNFFRPATDAVFEALTGALKAAPLLLEPLRQAFTDLGETWKDVIRQFGITLIRPEVINGFRMLVQQAGVLSTIVGRLLSGFVRLFVSVAGAAMPAFVELMSRAADAVQRLADGAQGSSRLSRTFNAGAAALIVWVDALGALVDLAMSLVEILGPFGNELVQWMADGVRALSKWLRTAKGQKQVRKFFEATLPAVKELIKFLVNLGIVFLQLVEFFAPFVQGFLGSLNVVLGVIKQFLGLLNLITNNPFFNAIKSAIGAFLGLRAATAILRLVGFLLSKIPLILANISKAVPSVVRVFSGLFSGILSSGRRFVVAMLLLGATVGQKFIEGVLSVGGSIVGLGARIIRFILRGARSLLTSAFNLGVWLIGQIGRGIASLATSVVNFGKEFVRRVIRGVRVMGTAIFDVGKWLLEGLINGFTTVGSFVTDAIKGLGKKIVDAVKDVLGIHSPSKVMERLGRFMLDGLIKGFTSGNVLDFIRENLGGIPALALQLAKAGLMNLPGALAGKLAHLGKDLLSGGLDEIGGLVGLARGGIVKAGRGGVAAAVGEGRHDEAVVPLSRTVLRALANAITAQMRIPQIGVPNLAAAGALAGGGSSITYQQDVTIQSPGGQYPDARYLAAQLDSEMKRRGGS